MCFMTKCPYVPPHPWNVDFPHLMLRAKAVRARDDGYRLRANGVLAATDAVGRIAGIPVVAEVVNALNRSGAARVLLEKTLGVDRDAPLPEFHSRTARRVLASLGTTRAPARRAERPAPQPTADTRGRSRCSPPATATAMSPSSMPTSPRCSSTTASRCVLVPQERCCGMPRLELGDLAGVARLKEDNIPQLAEAVAAGYDIVAPIPSCVLMFKQELPLMFPEDAPVQRVAARMFDPFEYLMLRHAAGLLRTDFKHLARQGELPRALSPAGAEHRPEDARPAQARAGHDASM